jgi:hypothetical protein
MLQAYTYVCLGEQARLQSPIASVDLYTGIVRATDLSDGVHINEAGSQRSPTAGLPR